MNHKQILTRGIALILVMLVVAACTAPSAAPCPTIAPQSCPTNASQSCPTNAPQSSPTAAMQAVPEMNAWRWGFTGGSANVIITFEPGDKCSMDIIQPITGSDWNTLNYEIVVNDQTYQNYLVDSFTVDPGITLEEMEASPGPPAPPPPWMHLKEVTFVNPMSRTLQAAAITITEGPFYFVCNVQGPDDLKIIKILGPLEVPTK